MLYTRKGDDGTTILYKTESGQRVKKYSPVIEALGSLDELNSWLGLCKARIQDKDIRAHLHSLQEDLFIIQAEVAGFPKGLSATKVKKLERITDDIEMQLPPIKSFFIPGANEESAMLDVARTLARKMERRVRAAIAANQTAIKPQTLAYVNRLSSALYALVRLANHRAGSTEQAPRYV